MASDRCLSLKDWEARAMLAGASVLVRPFALPGSEMHYGKPLNEWALSSLPFRWDGHREVLGAQVGDLWQFTEDREPRPGEWVMELQCDVDDHCTVPCGQPVFEGDTAILREGWRLGCLGGAWTEVEYRADGEIRRVTEAQWPRVGHPRPGDRWRSPQTMPAALARIRRRVGSVEAREIVTLGSGVWWDAGFVGDDTHTPEELALAWWLSRYGPGLWSGWVWVFSGLEEVSGE